LLAACSLATSQFRLQHRYVRRAAGVARVLDEPAGMGQVGPGSGGVAEGEVVPGVLEVGVGLVEAHVAALGDLQGLVQVVAGGAEVGDSGVAAQAVEGFQAVQHQQRALAPHELGQPRALLPRGAGRGVIVAEPRQRGVDELVGRRLAASAAPWE
jgi:hypothetical protein